MALEILCKIGLSSQPKYFVFCNFTLVTGQVTSNLLYTFGNGISDLHANVYSYVHELSCINKRAWTKMDWPVSTL